jgi:hypothetical protein
MGIRAINAMAAERNGVGAVPEPEFKPFRFPAGRRGTFAAEAAAGDGLRSEVVAAANSARAPRTLEELGVPRGLALEMEATLRLMGATEGADVVGRTFRTKDGVSYPLRLASAPSERGVERAA